MDEITKEFRDKWGKDEPEGFIGTNYAKNPYAVEKWLISTLKKRDKSLASKIEGLKKIEGKHDGHENDSRSWCYTCDEVGSEDEFTEWWSYNKALDSVLELLKESNEK